MSDDNYKPDGDAWGYYMPTYNPPHNYDYNETYVSKSSMYTDPDTGKTEAYIRRNDGMMGQAEGYVDEFGEFHVDKANLHDSGWYKTSYEDGDEYTEYSAYSGK